VKKLIYAVVVLGLSLGGVIGCGSGSNSSGPPGYEPNPKIDSGVTSAERKKLIFKGKGVGPPDVQGNGVAPPDVQQNSPSKKPVK